MLLHEEINELRSTMPSSFLTDIGQDLTRLKNAAHVLLTNRGPTAFYRAKVGDLEALRRTEAVWARLAQLATLVHCFFTAGNVRNNFQYTDRDGLDQENLARIGFVALPGEDVYVVSKSPEEGAVVDIVGVWQCLRSRLEFREKAVDESGNDEELMSMVEDNFYNRALGPRQQTCPVCDTMVQVHTACPGCDSSWTEIEYRCTPTVNSPAVVGAIAAVLPIDGDTERDNETGIDIYVQTDRETGIDIYVQTDRETGIDMNVQTDREIGIANYEPTDLMSGDTYTSSRGSLVSTCPYCDTRIDIMSKKCDGCNTSSTLLMKMSGDTSTSSRGSLVSTCPYCDTRIDMMSKKCDGCDTSSTSLMKNPKKDSYTQILRKACSYCSTPIDLKTGICKGCDAQFSGDNREELSEVETPMPSFSSVETVKGDSQQSVPDSTKNPSLIHSIAKTESPSKSMYEESAEASIKQSSVPPTSYAGTTSLTAESDFQNAKNASKETKCLPSDGVDHGISKLGLNKSDENEDNCIRGRLASKSMPEKSVSPTDENASIETKRQSSEDPFHSLHGWGRGRGSWMNHGPAQLPDSQYQACGAARFPGDQHINPVQDPGSWQCNQCKQVNDGGYKCVNCDNVDESLKKAEEVHTTKFEWKCDNCNVSVTERDCPRCKMEGPQKWKWVCEQCEFANNKLNVSCEVCLNMNSHLTTCGRCQYPMWKDGVEHVCMKKSIEEGASAQMEAAKSKDIEWMCHNCKVNVTGLNCPHCNKNGPQHSKWVCEKCGYFNPLLVEKCRVCSNINENLRLCPRCRKKLIQKNLLACEPCMMSEDTISTRICFYCPNDDGLALLVCAKSRCRNKVWICRDCRHFMKKSISPVCECCLYEEWRCWRRSCIRWNKPTADYCHHISRHKDTWVTQKTQGRIYNKWVCSKCEYVNTERAMGCANNYCHEAAPAKLTCSHCKIHFPSCYRKCIKCGGQLNQVSHV